MRKEKYIVEKTSTAKGKTGEISSFNVNIPYESGGIKNRYFKMFRVKDYTSSGAALKAAIKDRDQALVMIENQKMQGITNSRYTVEELFNQISIYYDRRKKTYLQYEKVYHKYIKPEYGEYDIRKVKESDILSTLKRCADSCGQNHVNKVKSIWHKIYSIAIRKGASVNDLTLFIETPKSDNITERSVTEQNITESDFEAFCEALSEYGHYLPQEKARIYDRTMILYMLKLMRITGIRPQEVKALTRDCIELFETENGEENAVLYIRRSVGSNRNEDLVIRDTKTPESKRSIPLDSNGAKLLHEIFEYSKYDLIFAHYDGTLFDVNDLSDYLYRVSKKCGIKVYAYLMRKSYSSDLYREDVSPAVIKKLMGHKGELMSLRAYATASDEEVVKASYNRKYKQ